MGLTQADVDNALFYTMNGNIPTIIIFIHIDNMMIAAHDRICL